MNARLRALIFVAVGDKNIAIRSLESAFQGH